MLVNMNKFQIFLEELINKSENVLKNNYYLFPEVDLHIMQFYVPFYLHISIFRLEDKIQKDIEISAIFDASMILLFSDT